MIQRYYDELDTTCATNLGPAGCTSAGSCCSIAGRHVDESKTLKQHMRQRAFEDWKPNPGIVATNCRTARHRSTCEITCDTGYVSGTLNTGPMFYQCHFYSAGR